MKGMKEMMRNSLRGRLWFGALVSAVAVLAAACSSSSNPGSSGSAQAGSATSAAAGSAAPAPSGAPVTVGVIYTANNQGNNEPGIPAGANAAADYINKELGGSAGPPAKVRSCHRKSAPASDTACASQPVKRGFIHPAVPEGPRRSHGPPVGATARLIH